MGVAYGQVTRSTQTTPSGQREHPEDMGACGMDARARFPDNYEVLQLVSGPAWELSRLKATQKFSMLSGGYPSADEGPVAGPDWAERRSF